MPERPRLDEARQLKELRRELDTLRVSRAALRSQRERYRHKLNAAYEDFRVERERAERLLGAVQHHANEDCKVCADLLAQEAQK